MGGVIVAIIIGVIIFAIFGSAFFN
jgi:hypothetical protein